MSAPVRPTSGKPGKSVYWAPPYATESTPVREDVHVIQPEYGKPDYSIPKAMISSIIMVIFGILNAIAFFTFAVFTPVFHTEFFLAAAAYLVTGIAGVFASLDNQRKKVLVYVVLVGAIASLILAITQIVRRSILLYHDDLLYRNNPRIAPFMIGFSILLLMLAIVIIFVSIILIIVASKMVCACCKRDE